MKDSYRIWHCAYIMYVFFFQMSDGVLIVNSDEEIRIENPEPFIPTNEWQRVKPGTELVKLL